MHLRSRGFTLIEMLVVMVILAILASSIAVVLINMGDKARVERARAQISTIGAALAAYCDEFGSYPPDTGYGLDMEASPGTYDAGSLWRYLHQRVNDQKTGKLAGPFLHEWPREDLRAYEDASGEPSFYLADPWGKPYAFVGTTRRLIHNPGGFNIFSCGSDEKTASDDAPAEPNLAYDGVDNDGNGTTDDASELGAAARNGGDDGDINNWSMH
jgi:prepilin-type N-terminal cleavage/methylation domain-containing protein